MVILVNKIQSLQIDLELRNIRLAHQRLLQYFKYSALVNHETVVNLDRPYKEIALELGFTAETMSRALLKLEKEGAIARQQNKIIIHNSSVARSKSSSFGSSMHNIV